MIYKNKNLIWIIPDFTRYWWTFKQIHFGCQRENSWDGVYLINTDQRFELMKNIGQLSISINDHMSGSRSRRGCSEQRFGLFHLAIVQLLVKSFKIVIFGPGACASIQLGFILGGWFVSLLVSSVFEWVLLNQPLNSCCLAPAKPPRNKPIP